MSTSIVSSYVSLEELKVSLGIPEKDAKADTKLLHILEDARTEVDMAIKPYVDDVPLEPGTDTYYHASKCVLAYGAAHWFEYVFNVEKARYYDEKFEKKLEHLVNSIKSDKPDRTEAAFVQGEDPLRDRIYPTSSVHQYLTREFY